ncbi:hypothetical protein MXB_5031, partial [Myxobolus squamalis]
SCVKEKIFVVDNKSTLRTILVEGNSLKEINVTPNEVRLYQNKSQQIRAIKFGPSIGNPLVAVMFQESFQIWNSASLTVIYDSKRHFDSVTVDLDWISANMPIVLFNDGTVQILDILKTSLTIPEKYLYHKNTFTSFFLSNEIYLTVKFLLIYGFHILKSPTIQNLSELLSRKLSIRERAIFVTSVLSEECDIHFWKLADFYIRFFSDGTTCMHLQLEPGYGSLCDLSALKRSIHWYAVYTREINRDSSPNPSAFEYICKWLLYLKEYNEAVSLLVNVDPLSPNFFKDLYKSLVIEGFRQNDNLDNTVYLHAATKLMSFNKIHEAVDLLLLTNHDMQACTYLAENGMLDLSIILAK